MPKNLSVNNNSLPPADEGCGKLQQRCVAGFGLFEADQQFTVSIEPGVSSFNHPAARFGVRVAILNEPLFGARFHARMVVMFPGDLADRIAHVACIKAEILVVFPPSDFRTRNGDLCQRPIQQLGVVKICAADGDRQREPTAVHQQTAFAPFFSRG